MGVERCDKIISLIDQCLAGPNLEHADGRNCWRCTVPHNGGPAGLCDKCLEKLRDPALAVDGPTLNPTDQEKPARLEGAYEHRPGVLRGDLIP